MFIMFFPSQMNFWWNSTVCGWTPRLCRLPKGMCRRIRQGQVPGTQMTRGKLRLLASPGFRLGVLSTCSSSRFCHVFAISKTCSVLLYTYEQAICRWITLPHRALRLAPYHTFGHAVRGLEDSNISKPQLLPIQLEIKVAIHFQYARFIGRSGNISIFDDWLHMFHHVDAKTSKWLHQSLVFFVLPVIYDLISTWYPHSIASYIWLSPGT